MDLSQHEIEKRVSVLKVVSIFSQTSEDHLKEIAKLFSSVKFQADEKIFEKGDPGDSMYIISSGSVKIHDGTHVFITLFAEQSFGEFALIDAKVRTASATAVEEAELLRLDQRTFFSIYERNIEFSRGVLKSIVKRFNDKDFLEAQLTQQKKEIEEKNKEIEEKNKDITDSIRYAKRIQQALLYFDPKINSIVPESFIYFRPKDIVSGDFYWVKLIDRAKVLIATAADCTGHGVPGAFMSMLGVTALNEICNRPDIKHANEVLNKLRNYIIKSLNQTGKEGEQKDGMDIAMVAFHYDVGKLEFSGANNPLIVIRNNEIIEYDGDPMPIGIHDRVDIPFTNYEIDVQKSDIVYLFSDGFPDQFGGERGKKYMYKRFKEFLLRIHDKPMAEQRELIEQESVTWRGALEQIDDQLIMGIKF
ncbi:MAG: cyclic nucleotide-binding domain-containing protein [Bacteroidia bacterium]|nr:cyclic nucleotide-binding domain-containing protein [Bacteroidia bacterium]